MGLILDTNVLITGERQGTGIGFLLGRLEAQFPSEQLAISCLSLLELAQGVERAKSSETRLLRLMFIQEVRESLRTLPLTADICFAAGRLSGELTRHGNTVGIVDLMIGSTALALECAVLTRNMRDFSRIPGLQVIEY